MRTVRDHWGIENRLHWVLDMTFGEDGLRAVADQRSIRKRRQRCGWDLGPWYSGLRPQPAAVLTGRPPE